MTIDDENSVYVGNLPYDATEDSLRSVFDLYGQIIAVKIINDRGVGAKCYGFITYANPRSAVDAISDMDGRVYTVGSMSMLSIINNTHATFFFFFIPIYRCTLFSLSDMADLYQTIDGRIVKVNEVKTRGGRPNFGRDSFRRNNDRDMELDRGRDRDRDRDRNRDHGRVRDRTRDQNREWSRDRDQDKERGYERAHDVDRTLERFTEKDRGHDRDKDIDTIECEHERDRDQAWEKERRTDRDQEDMQIGDIHHGSGNKYKDQMANIAIGDRHSRDHPSGSSRSDHDQVAKQLDVSHQKVEELQKEISLMEELVEERGDHVSKLQEKSQKLEDALASAKKLTSNRKKQLIKLHTCFLNMKEYGEKLKSCEEEFQCLVRSMEDVDNNGGLLA